MLRLLRDAGFAETRPLTRDEARQAYFTGRTDDLSPSDSEFLVWARVSSLDQDGPE